MKIIAGTEKTIMYVNDGNIECRLGILIRGCEQTVYLYMYVYVC